MRSAFVLALVAAAALAPAPALAQSPTTTRVETRPFYGATVTLEEGVRVFRPLPPHERVIINPNGATPLSLGFVEKRAVSHNYHYGDGPREVSAYAGSSGGWAVPRRGHKGHHHRGHGHRGVLSPGGHGGRR